MNQQGLQAVPSPQNKKPNKAKYYRGGYTAKKYGSRDRGDIDAIQMEFPKTMIMYVYYLLLCGIFLPGISGYSLAELSKIYNYIKYEPGDTNTNIIITVPHGGHLYPSTQINGKRWSDRQQYGCKRSGSEYCIWMHSCGGVIRRAEDCKARTPNDLYTIRIARDIADGIKATTGFRPHVVYNMLKRSKLDANRDIYEATFQVPDAIIAYQFYNYFISQARSAITGRGLLLDIHGQAHKPERTELGYLISRNNLNNGRYSVEQTSIRSLGERWCGRDNTCFKDFIHGNRSLGYFMNQQGLGAVPSPQNKKRNMAKYFRGGYTVKNYGSRDGGDIDAIQMEFPQMFRKRWGTESKNKVVRAIISFLNQNYQDEDLKGKIIIDSPGNI
ncbi:hypothetical protein OS493_008775 [Desmophyllum pertusum]|uniref:Uncharacterized protein n=1 Tax=Desmophyllum pertusum TaxID=174260 RepID=A0A9X0D6G3_9CNID|nr:hypothetical protein OS493_008775 [Desmophyllum pertusum]